MIKLLAIGRNDAATALAFYKQEERKPEGISPDDSEVLMMLQDDPADLVAAIEAWEAAGRP